MSTVHDTVVGVPMLPAASTCLIATEYDPSASPLAVFGDVHDAYAPPSTEQSVDTASPVREKETLPLVAFVIAAGWPVIVTAPGAVRSIDQVTAVVGLILPEVSIARRSRICVLEGARAGSPRAVVELALDRAVGLCRGRK